MPQVAVNPSRFDPYENFRFRVIWDGRVVAGVSRISGLSRTTEVMEHREGGDPSTSRKSPGRTSFAAIVLERGMSQDHDFEAWANEVWTLGGDASQADFRRDVRIEIEDEAGQPVLAYDVFRCWVSAYEALPQLDANATAVLIESITLEHEGWSRDGAVAAPASG